MINVVYVNDSAVTGGSVQEFLEVLSYLKKNGEVNPIVLTPYNDALSDQLVQLNIEHYKIGHREFCYDMKTDFVHRIMSPIINIRYRLSDIKACKNASKVLDWNNIDLIHSNIDRVDIGGILARKYHIPHVWHLREHTTGDFELRFKRKQPFQYMNKLADAFVAVSESVKNDWSRRGLKKTSIKVISDGIVTSRYSPSDQRANQFRIVFIGEIKPQKGQYILLQALSELPDEVASLYTVDFYGSGKEEYIEELKKYIIQNHLKAKVNFKGYINEIPNAITNYSIGVNGSKREAFGRITIEYMSAGLLVLASNSGANPELICNGKDGYLFNDYMELSMLLKKYSENPENYIKVRKKAFEKAHSNFDIKNTCEHLLNLYQTLLNQ